VGNDQLVVGPLLRHVTETTAAVWVETSDSATVTVRAGGRTWEARTFAAHGHHYALVEVDGLEPGSAPAYEMSVDGARVWPPPDSRLPPSRLATLEPGKPLRLAYGSCRVSEPHDREGNERNGVDALRAYALEMAGDTHRWPDLVLYLGDQVYADETSERMREFIRSRRSVEEPPGEELKDFEEYCHLYRLAWSDPAIRWLLSTLPSAMIFDDHDIRDDWNTSYDWRREMEATSWWHDRIVGGLGSYWVYQHLGNLSPEERADDELWRRVAAGDPSGEVDLTEALDEFAARVDRRPDTYRWSFAREIGGCRLVVVDSRAARRLTPGERSILDPDEMTWLDGHMRGDTDHLLVGTSLPFLLGPGLHRLEAWSEAIADGGWGRPGKLLGERLRRAGDLEHWAAFQDGFREVARMAVEVATGTRGRPPRTVTFLSGDVHHSYLARVRPEDVAGPDLASPTAEILQAVCSPIRNPLPRAIRLGIATLARGLSQRVGPLTRSAGLRKPPFRWDLVGPAWYDNNLATLEVEPEGLRLRWARGVDDGADDQSRIETVASFLVGDGVREGPR
jgi:hypothetical protein